MVYEASEWNSCAADKRVSILGFHLPLGDHVHGLDATYGSGANRVGESVRVVGANRTDDPR